VATDRNSELKITATLDAKDVVKGGKDAEEAVRGIGSAAEYAAADLSKTASSADDLARSEGNLAEGASEAAGALQKLGATGSAAEGEIAAGAGSAAAGVAEITTAAGGANAEVDELGETARKNVAVATAEFKKAAEAVRASNVPLDEQKRKLEEIEKEVRAVKDEFQSVPGIDAAVEAGLEEVRKKIVEVDDEIKEQSESIKKQKAQWGGLSEDAQAALTALGGKTEDVDNALANAAIAIQKVNNQIETTGTVSKGAVGKAAEAYENATAAVKRFEQAGGAASPVHVAALQKLEAELGNVTNKAAGLTQANKDQAVGLQETGQQATQLASSFATIASSIGVVNPGVSTAIGRFGSLGIIYENVKDQAKALDLNTLALGASLRAQGTAAGALSPRWLALGTQIGATVVAMIAATKAGKEFASTSDANKESWEQYTKVVKEWVAVDLGRRLGGVQKAFAEFGANVWSNVIPPQEAITKGLQEYTIAVQKGGFALELYRGLLREGVSDEVAFEAALNSTREAQETYKNVVDLGGEALREWSEQAKKNAKDAKALGTVTVEMRDAMAAAVKVQRLLAEAQKDVTDVSEKDMAVLRSLIGVINQHIDSSEKRDVLLRNASGLLSTYVSKLDGLSRVERERLTIIAELTAKGKDLDAGERELLKRMAEQFLAAQKASGAMNVLNETLGKFDTAIDGTTHGITDHLTVASHLSGVWSSMHGTWAQNAVVLQDLGGEMNSLAAKTKDLDAADRERLVIIADLLSRAPELGASQQKLAQDLLTQATSGAKATKELNELARIHATLDLAVNGTTEKLTTELNVLKTLATEGWDKNSVAIGVAIGKVGELLTSTDNLDASQRKLFTTIQNGFEKINGLTGKMKDLQGRYDELQILSDRRTKDQDKEIISIGQQIAATSNQITWEQILAKGRIGMINANEKLAISNSAIVGGYKDGRKVITNAADDYGALKDVVGDVGKAAAQAAEAQGKVQLVYVDGKAVIKQVGDATAELKTETKGAADESNKLWDAAARAAAEGKGFDSAAKETKDSTEKMKDGFAEAATIVAQLETNIRTLTATLGLYAIQAEKAANAGLGSRLKPVANLQ